MGKSASNLVSRDEETLNQTDATVTGSPERSSVGMLGDGVADRDHELANTMEVEASDIGKNPQTEAVDAEAGHDAKDKGLDIYLRLNDDTATLLPPHLHNQFAHAQPKFMAELISGLYNQRLAETGRITKDGMKVTWSSSFLPFHLVFVFLWQKSACYRLVSVRNSIVPDQFARGLVSSAKAFLSRSEEDELHDIAFCRTTVDRDDWIYKPERQKLQTEATVVCAQEIIKNFGSLENLPIRAAENTANLINHRKIFSNLLHHLTTPSKKVSKPSEVPKHKERARGLRPRRSAMEENEELPNASDSKEPQDEQGPTKSSVPAQDHCTSLSPIEDVADLDPAKTKTSQESTQACYDHGSGEEDKMNTTQVPCNSKPSSGSEDSMSSLTQETTRMGGANGKHESMDADGAGSMKSQEVSPTPVREILRERRAMSDSAPPPDNSNQNSTPLPVVPSKSMIADSSAVKTTIESAQTVHKPHQDSASPVTQATAQELTGTQPPESSLSRRPSSVPGARVLGSANTEELPRASSNVFNENSATQNHLLTPVTVCLPMRTVERSGHAQNEDEQRRMGTGTPVCDAHSNAKKRTTSVGKAPEETPASSSTSSCPHGEESAYYCPTCRNITDPEALRAIAFIKAEQERVKKLIKEQEELLGPAAASSSGVLSVADSDDSIKNITWAYATNTAKDEELKKRGIWLWRKPPTYFRERELHQVETKGGMRPAPVKISPLHTSSTHPAVLFDGKTVEIVPHTNPWPDIRSSIGHPDFLPSTKLCEYQACEINGYAVWRFDRDVLQCNLPSCNSEVFDHVATTIICPGCGPFTKIRYCSIDHQLLDSQVHWQKCGHHDLLLRKVYDQSTIPLRFSEMCPMIPERNNVNSFPLHRQKITATISRGHYTLFNPNIPVTTTLSWPKEYTDPKVSPDIDRRIERLLNAAFLDVQNTSLIEYLYRVLRALVQKVPRYDSALFTGALKEQFFQEFRRDVSTVDSRAICECEWFGPIFKGAHHPRCPHKTTSSTPSQLKLVKGGIKHELERLEARHWILRAWQQQHEKEEAWIGRAQGFGFPGQLSGFKEHYLGPRFSGWGTKEDNILSAK